MKRIVMLAAALIAAPLGAKSADERESSARMETAERVIQGIREGEVTKVDGLFGLSRAEYAELARLKGCRGSDPAISTDRKIVVDWICEAETSAPGMSRRTEMTFDDGVLVGFAINPHVSDFAPLERAAQVSSVTGRKDLAQQFADMVTASQAGRFGTLVPVNDHQVSRLGYFVGGDFRVSEPKGERVAVDFKALNGQELVVYVHFDTVGHPVGLTFAPTTCTNCDQWVRNQSPLKFDDRRKRDRRFLTNEINRQNQQRATDRQINRAIRHACPDCP